MAGLCPEALPLPEGGDRFAPPPRLGVRIAEWSAKRAEGVVRAKAWGGATSPLPQPGVSLPHLVVPLRREREAPTGMSLTSPRGDAESGLRGPRRSPPARASFSAFHLSSGPAPRVGRGREILCLKHPLNGSERSKRNVSEGKPGAIASAPF